MLNALKNGKIDSFRKLNIDFGWVEIMEDKMQDFDEEMRESEKDEYKKVFATQRIKTVLK